MKDAYGSRDNGHTFGGKYGMTNPVVGWLINRGLGELVALTSDELEAQEKAPACKAPAEQAYEDKRGKWRWRKVSGLCRAPMRYRAEGWVCYEHAEPVRQPRAPRLQYIPPPPFSWLEVIGKEVDLVYRREPWEQRGSWKYIVDGVAR